MESRILQHDNNFLPVDPHSLDPGGGVKKSIQLFQNMVMLHIKLNGITNAATCPPIPP